MLYNKKANMVLQDIDIGSLRYKQNDRIIKHRCIPPPLTWLK